MRSCFRRRFVFDASTMDTLVRGLTSSLLPERLASITEIRRRLCLPKPPINELIAIEGAIAQIAALLVLPAGPGDSTKVQLEASWCLTNISGSPKKAHTAATSSAIPALAKMLSTSLPVEVREQALLCISNIAGENEVYRDSVLREGVVVALRKCLASHNTVPEKFLQTAAIFMTNVTSGSPPPRVEDVAPLIPVLKVFLRSRNPAVLEDGLGALANISASDLSRPAVLLADVVDRVVELASHVNSVVQKPALRVLTALSKGPDEAPQQLVTAPFLAALTGFLAKGKLQKSAAQLVGALCTGPPAQIDKLVKAGILNATLLKIAADTEVTARLACIAITNASRNGSKDTLASFSLGWLITSLKSVLSRPNFPLAQEAAIDCIAAILCDRPAVKLASDEKKNEWLAAYVARNASRQAETHVERFGVPPPDETSSKYRKRMIERSGLPEAVEALRDGEATTTSVRAAARKLLTEHWPYLAFDRASDSDGEDGSFDLFS